jgi:hypothetical protein
MSHRRAVAGTAGVKPLINRTSLPAIRQRAMVVSMSDPTALVPETFTASERDYIRRELDLFFSTLSTVADGFQLKRWRGGQR